MRDAPLDTHAVLPLGHDAAHNANGTALRLGFNSAAYDAPVVAAHNLPATVYTDTCRGAGQANSVRVSAAPPPVARSTFLAVTAPGVDRYRLGCGQHAANEVTVEVPYNDPVREVAPRRRRRIALGP
jgi:hypothetical protein